MKRIAIVIALGSCWPGCVYRTGPWVRDIRAVAGGLEVRRCEATYQGLLGGALHEENCEVETVSAEWLDTPPPRRMDDPR